MEPKEELRPTLEAPEQRRTVPWGPVLVLALTCAVSLFWSRYTPLWIDEFFQMQTDTVPGLAQVVSIQRSYPVALDPMLYHVLAHVSTKVFGANAFALRLPALIGFLLLQACLFVFVRRISTYRAAIFAMVFPAVTGDLYFSLEGRPYGVLLGLSGVVMLAWQTAARRSSHRLPALITLAVALALAVNTHYFGVLLLVPLTVAEVYRALERRRIDVGVMLSIAAGTCGLGLVVPFAKAAAEFKMHYFNLANIGFKTPFSTYWTLFGGDHLYRARAQEIYAVILLAVAVLTVVGWTRIFHRRVEQIPRPDFVLALAISAMPFLSFALARLVTKTQEPRHVCETIAGIAVLCAVGLDQALRSRRAATPVMALVLCLVFLPNGFLQLYRVRRNARESTRRYLLPADVRARILGSPTGLLYTADISLFDAFERYEPDPAIRSRIALVYSTEDELRFARRNTFSLTALHMERFTNYDIEDFQSVARQSGEHVFLTVQSGDEWDWVHGALADDKAAVQQIGSLPGGMELLSVHFRSPQPKAAGPLLNAQ